MKELVVELTPIDQSNWREANKVLVRDDQLRFVAAHQPVALVILAKAFLQVDGKDWEPYAFLNDQREIVGVVALAFEDVLCELFHLAIDQTMQGRGYGTAAVASIIEYATGKRSCTSLSLTVHPDNANADHIYKQAGFVATGETRNGEPILLFTRERQETASAFDS
jgi:diamine N-acetyltransferase